MNDICIIKKEYIDDLNDQIKVYILSMYYDDAIMVGPIGKEEISKMFLDGMKELTDKWYENRKCKLNDFL